MPKPYRKVSLVLLVLSTIFLFSSKIFQENALAAISTCSATVSPSSAQPNTTEVQFDFTVTNNDSVNTVRWFRITKPSTGIIFRALSLYGWAKNIVGESVVYTEGTITPGGSANPWFTVNIGDITVSNSWIVEVSDDASGANPTTCSGDLVLTISSSGQDTTPPVISGLTLSDITTTSAKISWTTDEPTSSLVQYDVNVDMDLYPFSHSDTSLVTAHAITVTNSVASNTTYYYRVCSSDAAGNQTCTSENSFTTAKATSTTATTTTTTIITVTPTPTPVSTTATVIATPVPVDRTPPVVNIITDLSQAYEITPTISGIASDNKGVHHVDYSVDGGKNWLSVDVLEEMGARSTNYQFTPLLAEDGNYEIRVRAMDAESNTGMSSIKTLVIDRLPPRVGGNLLSMGPLALLPNKQGTIVTLSGLEQRITLSAVGGPTSIDLLIGEKMSSLSYSAETGLWTGALNLNTPGTYNITTKAVDGAGNITERNLNPIKVLQSGQVIEQVSGKPLTKGEISLYAQDSQTKFWSLWDGETFGQDNPQTLDEDGQYEFFLPAGTYYLTIKVPGKGKNTSRIFSLSETTPFNANFEFAPPKRIGLGPISFPLPSLFSDKFPVLLTKEKENVSESLAKLEGIDFPSFSLPSTSGIFDSKSLSGQVNVITFVSTWSPPAIEQISLLDDFVKEAIVSVTVVDIQETESMVSVFQKRGGYSLPIVIDKDGSLIEPFDVHSLPTHYFVDRRGTVKRVVTGVMSAQEITDMVSEVL